MQSLSIDSSSHHSTCCISLFRFVPAGQGCQGPRVRIVGGLGFVGFASVLGFVWRVVLRLSSFMHGVMVECLLFNGLFRELLMFGFRWVGVVAGCASLYRFVIAIRLRAQYNLLVERESLIY